jgi:hypothetical protein
MVLAYAGCPEAYSLIVVVGRWVRNSLQVFSSVSRGQCYDSPTWDLVQDSWLQDLNAANELRGTASFDLQIEMTPVE